MQNQPRQFPLGSTSYRSARIIRERNRIEGIILQSFEKNKQYNQIRFKFYSSENDLKTGYKLGEINAFFSTQDFVYDGITNYDVTYLGRYFSIIYNSANPKLNDVSTREVLTKSLDVQSLLDQNENYLYDSL